MLGNDGQPISNRKFDSSTIDFSIGGLKFKTDEPIAIDDSLAH